MKNAVFLVVLLAGGLGYADGSIPEGFHECVIGGGGKAYVRWDSHFIDEPQSHDMQKAFLFAVKQLIDPLVLNTPLLIGAEWSDEFDSSSAYAHCGPEHRRMLPSEEGKTTVVPISLYCQIMGERPVVEEGEEECDFIVTWNKHFIDYMWYGTASTCPDGEYKPCFVDIAIHEMIHGLGFASWLEPDGQWCPIEEWNFPTLFDRRITIMGEEKLCDIEPYSRILYGVLDQFYFTGPNLQYFLTHIWVTDPLTMLPGILSGGHIKLDEVRTSPFKNSSHYGDIFSRLLIMSPSTSGGLKIPDIRVELMTLADCGYLLSGFKVHPPVDESKWPYDPAKSEKAFERELVTMNFNEYEIRLVSARIVSGRSEAFELAPIEEGAVIGKLQSHSFTANFNPSGPGFYAAELLINYLDTEDNVHRTSASLRYYVAGVDADEDGISDYEEHRDLDLSTPEIDNPFGVGLDMLGNSYSVAPDGIPDGENDWDGDGYSNAYEFEQGRNPLVPDEIGGLPVIDDGYSYPVRVKNSAPFPIACNSITIEGENASDFIITSQSYKLWLGPGKETTVSVAFTPDSPGEKNAILRVEFVVGGQSLVKEVKLMGEGATSS